MTDTRLHDKLASLVAFQCVLVALRGGNFFGSLLAPPKPGAGGN